MDRFVLCMHLHKPAYAGLTSKIKYEKFLTEIGIELISHCLETTLYPPPPAAFLDTIKGLLGSFFPKHTEITRKIVIQEFFF